MAGLEVVVRPVVFPDIRPQPARSLPPADDPAQGICEIKGTSSFVVTFSNSTSWSASYGKTKEVKRRVDTVRVFQKDKDGTVNKDNFVDIEVANKLWMEGGAGPVADVSSGTPGVGSEMTMQEREVWYLQRAKEEDNIEIIDRDKIKEADKENN